MEDNTMETINSMDFYKMVRENRFAMYSKPRRYYNRDGIKGSAIKFLFFVQAIIFFLMLMTIKTASGQNSMQQNMLTSDASQGSGTIANYTTIYNSGKVFLNWTARNEAADCIYIVERSSDGKVYESVGIKEGIGTAVELFYSWMDQTPPNGYAFYRVKKIARDGSQYYSATNAVINLGSSYDPNANYASGKKDEDLKKQ
jgi:hypothetical protein